MRRLARTAAAALGMQHNTKSKRDAPRTQSTVYVVYVTACKVVCTQLAIKLACTVVVVVAVDVLDVCLL